MKYNKIIDYMTGVSSSVSEMHGEGVKMSKEIGDTSVSIFVKTNSSGEYWFAGFISYIANRRYNREKIESSKVVKTEEEIIKLIEITIAMANKLNVISEKYLEVERLERELSGIGDINHKVV